MLSKAGDASAFLRIWSGVQGTNPALEIGVLAARICYLMTQISGGAAAGLATVMRMYCAGFYDAMAEAGLFGPSAEVMAAETGLIFSENESLGSAPPSAFAAVTAACAPAEATGDRRSSSGLRRLRSTGLPTGAAVTAAGSPSRRIGQADASEKLPGAIKAELPSDDPAARGSHQAVRAAASTAMVQCVQPAESALLNRRLGGIFCACCGMCGRKRCADGKNKFYRKGAKSVCTGVPVACSQYCSGCVCEVFECYGPQNKNRWCKAHAKTYSVDDSRRQYSNPFSARQSYLPQWAMELRVIARVAFALPRMLPTDLEVLLAAPGHEHLTSVHVVKLFIAHAIKWPWLVTAFLERTSSVSELPVTAEGRGAVARQFTDALLEVAEFASGCPMKDMFDRMNSGLGNAVTGIAVQGQEVGVIAKVRSSRLGQSGGKEVSLGPQQTPYSFADEASEAAETCTEIFSAILNAASEEDWSWPADSEKFKAFATRGLALANKARSLQVNGFGFKGGRTAECQYMSKHFTRALLLCNPRSGYEVYSSSWCESAGSCGIAALPLSTILAWTPDERSHCDLIAKQPCGDVEQLLGVHPMLVSAWSCLAGQVPADGQAKILGASDAVICTVLDADEALQERMPPAKRFRMGLRALAIALDMPSSGSGRCSWKRPAGSGDGRGTKSKRNRQG